MFLFVVGVLLGLISLPLIFVGTKEFEGSYGDTFKVPFRIIGLVVAGLAGVIVLLSSSYSQDAGEAVLIKSPSGEVIDVDQSSGWGFTAPWNSTSTWDLRNQNIIWKGNGEDVDDKEIKVGLQGSGNAYVDQVVTYNIRGADIEDIYNRYRSQDQFEEQGLIPAGRSNTQDQGGNYEPFTIKEQRIEFNQDVTDAVTTRFDELGVDVVTVEMTDLRLDEGTETRLQEVINRQAEVEEANAALEAARIASETVREEAKAEADADQIARCGATTREVTKVVSGREIQTTEVVPVPDGQCQNRLNEQVLLNKWIEAVTAMSENGNGVVIPMELEAILDVGTVNQPQG